jgi:glycosyltransferase involved in cell wall biosynthesis
MNPSQAHHRGDTIHSSGEGVQTILQVLPALEIGGVELGTIEVAQALQKSGLRPLVASAGGKMVEQLSSHNITHIQLPLASKNPLIMIKNIWDLYQVIRDSQVDLVHARSRAPAWSAYAACWLAKVPFVTTFHGTYNLQNVFKKFYNSIMVRGIKVIAISHYIQEHILKNYKCWVRPEDVQIIARGVDTHRFDPKKINPDRIQALRLRWGVPEGIPIVVLPGRLTRWKGQEVLLKALGMLRKRGIAFHVVLAGSPQGRHAYAQELLRLAEAQGVRDCVVLDEACPDVPAMYAAASVVVHASTDPEAFGRVLVEAQVMNTPLIASALGAPLEIVDHGKTGFLTPPGDAKALTDQLYHVLTLSQEDREKLVRAARRSALAHFTADKMTQATIKLYKEVMESWTQR